MEIEIEGIRKQANKESDLEKAIRKAKVSKEPPFYPEIEKAIERIPDKDPETIGDAIEAVREVSEIFRDACQYYTNLLVPPDGKKFPLELPIIAIAAKITAATISKALMSGQFGERARDFYLALDALGDMIGGQSVTSSDGKRADKRCFYRGDAFETEGAK